VGNATRVLLLRRWLSSIVRTRLGDPNVWSGRALQEGSFELADVRFCITVSGLLLEPLCSGPSWIWTK
jgi:hypothetical protein